MRATNTGSKHGFKGTGWDAKAEPETEIRYYTKEEIDGIRDIQGQRHERVTGDPTERKPYEVTAEDREAFEEFMRQKERKRIQAIGRGGLSSARDCVAEMVKSDLFDDEEVEQYILKVYERNVPLACEIAGEFGVFGCTPEPKPKPKPAPTAEELYGGPAYVEQTLPDGTKLSRPASPDELKAARQQAILSTGSYQQQIAAFKADPSAFDD